MGGCFPGVKVANRGIGGDTSRGVLIRLEEDVLSLHPSGVVLLIGTNDLEDQAEPETVVGNLKRIVAALERSDPRMPIVLCEVFPSSATMKRPAEKIKRLNELYAEAVKGDRRITVLDTWTLFADAKGDAPAAQFPDLLHPNAAGYAKWAAALRPILATLGFIDTEPYTFTPEAGFVSLFNGHDLTGWGFEPTSAADIQSARNWQASDPHAAAWPIVKHAVAFDGKTASDDGRYVAMAGRLVVTTAPEGRRIQQLLNDSRVSAGFHPPAGVSSHAKRRQRHLHPRTAAAMPRLPARRTIQPADPLPASGVERDRDRSHWHDGALHLQWGIA